MFPRRNMLHFKKAVAFIQTLLVFVIAKSFARIGALLDVCFGKIACSCHSCVFETKMLTQCLTSITDNRTTQLQHDVTAAGCEPDNFGNMRLSSEHKVLSATSSQTSNYQSAGEPPSHYIYHGNQSLGRYFSHVLKDTHVLPRDLFPWGHCQKVHRHSFTCTEPRSEVSIKGETMRTSPRGAPFEDGNSQNDKDETTSMPQAVKRYKSLESDYHRNHAHAEYMFTNPPGQHGLSRPASDLFLTYTPVVFSRQKLQHDTSLPSFLNKQSVPYWGHRRKIVKGPCKGRSIRFEGPLDQVQQGSSSLTQTLKNRWKGLASTVL